MKQKNQNNHHPLHPLLALIGYVALICMGCSTIQPDQDPIVVRAEQTASIALTGFDALFKLEYDNREWIDRKQPEIRDAVNHLRDYAPTLLGSLRSATKEYKALQNEATRSRLENLLASAARGLAEASEIMARINSEKIE